MSISEASPVIITHDIAKKISNEILGGSIRFCKEAGYKQNITMVSFFWSAFLLASKRELVKNGLLKDVMRCYIYSIGKVFPQVVIDTELKSIVTEQQQHFWTDLNKDFVDLKTSDNISSALHIANKLNSDDGISASYMRLKDPVSLFLQISSSIDSSIYRYLCDVDSEIAIEHRHILDRGYVTKPSISLETKPQYTPPQPTYDNKQTKTQKRAESFTMKMACVFLVLFIVIFVAVIFTKDSDPGLEPIPEPQSGTMLFGSEYSNGSEITVTAAHGKSCVVKLKTTSGATRLSFYVRAGDTVTVGVPEENLYVYFASGKTWYGLDNLFGEKTDYSMDDEVCNFIDYYSCTYRLYPVNNGNFQPSSIDADDF